MLNTMWLLDRHISSKVQTLTPCTFKMLKGCVIIESCKSCDISYLVYSIFAYIAIGGWNSVGNLYFAKRFIILKIFHIILKKTNQPKFVTVPKLFSRFLGTL